MIWHSTLISRWMAFVLFASAQVMSAESAELVDVQNISDETAVLRERKNIVLQTYQINAKACWLNAKRRALKEAERLERLSDKSAPLQNPPHSIKAIP